VQKAPIIVGDRDPRSGEYLVRSGLADGERVLRHPTTLLKDGQKVEMTATPAAVGNVPAATAAAATVAK
jgi:hypothetical protein